MDVSFQPLGRVTICPNWLSFFTTDICSENLTVRWLLHNYCNNLWIVVTLFCDNTCDSSYDIIVFSNCDYAIVRFWLHIHGSTSLSWIVEPRILGSRILGSVIFGISNFMIPKVGTLKFGTPENPEFYYPIISDSRKLRPLTHPNDTFHPCHPNNLNHWCPNHRTPQNYPDYAKISPNMQKVRLICKELYLKCLVFVSYYHPYLAGVLEPALLLYSTSFSRYSLNILWIFLNKVQLRIHFSKAEFISHNFCLKYFSLFSIIKSGAPPNLAISRHIIIIDSKWLIHFLHFFLNGRISILNVVFIDLE